MTRRRVALLVFSLWAIVAFIGCHATFASQPVRARAARRAIAAVSEGIRGSMTVGNFVHVSDDGWASGRSILIEDERGNEVIFAEEADVRIDVLSLFGNHVRFTEAIARRGRVHLVERADHTWGIDIAFRGAGEGGPSPTVSFDDLEVFDTQVVLQAQNAPRIVIDGVHAHISIRAGNGPTTLRYWSATGNARIRDPLPLEVRIDGAWGHFDGSAAARFRTRARGNFMGDDTEVSLLLREEDGEMRLTSDTHASGVFSGALGVALDLAL